ncbi:hypothetical protein OIV83_000174 [Microbotryomycetes sp. JL201]|nr:hypothetical protein OIV83_000174 [Microbotryomycetes sp. JL201]
MARNESNVGKRKTPSNPPFKKSSTKKGKSSNYNAFVNAKLDELKKSDPELDHKERLKRILAQWKVQSFKLGQYPMFCTSLTPIQLAQQQQKAK